MFSLVLNALASLVAGSRAGCVGLYSLKRASSIVLLSIRRIMMRVSDRYALGNGLVYYEILVYVWGADRLFIQRFRRITRMVGVGCEDPIVCTMVCVCHYEVCSYICR